MKHIMNVKVRKGQANINEKDEVKNESKGDNESTVKHTYSLSSSSMTNTNTPLFVPVSSETMATGPTANYRTRRGGSEY